MEFKASSKTKRTPTNNSTKKGQTGANKATIKTKSPVVETSNRYTVLADDVQIHPPPPSSIEDKGHLNNSLQREIIHAPVCPTTAPCASTPIKRRQSLAEYNNNSSDDGHMAGKKSKLSANRKSVSHSNNEQSSFNTNDNDEIESIEYSEDHINETRNESPMNEITQKQMRTVYIHGTEKSFNKIKYNEFDRINNKIRKHIPVESIEKKGNFIRVICQHKTDRDKLLKVDSIDDWLVAVTVPYSLRPGKTAVEDGYQAATKRNRRYVIHNVPVEIPNEYIQEYLGSECEKAIRIISRKAGEQTPTETVILYFKTPQNTDDKINISYLKFKLFPYVPRPTRCAKCQKFGHRQDLCRHTKTRCVRCGSWDHPAEGCPVPIADRKCLHCGEAHSAAFRGCKKYLTIQSNLKTMSQEGVSYAEAVRINKNDNKTPKQNFINVKVIPTPPQTMVHTTTPKENENKQAKTNKIENKSETDKKITELNNKIDDVVTKITAVLDRVVPLIEAAVRWFAGLSGPGADFSFLDILKTIFISRQPPAVVTPSNSI